MFRSALLGFLLLSLVTRAMGLGAEKPPPSVGLEDTWPSLSEFRFQRGDNSEWARADFDDSRWATIDRFELPSHDGIYWVRFRITTRWQNPARPRDTLGLAVVASYDVFWDGRLIGRNGRVGASPETEEPGVVDSTFRIPDELNALGEHAVALRISSFHTGFPGRTYGLTPRVFALADYLALRTRAAAFSLVAVGGALVVGLVFGLMWLLADRKAAHGWFSLACLVAAAQQALQAWRGLLEYPYSWHYPRLLAITLLVGVLGLLLVAFLQSFFQSPHRMGRIGLLLAAFVAVWPVSPMYNVKAVAMAWCGVIFASLVAFQAWRERRRGAAYVFGGLLLSALGLIASPADFLEHSFVFSSGAGMLGCITALTLQLRDERRTAHQAQLAAARLEIELLKKNIQPHFVLNTLATLMEVIEQEPKTAVTLVDALAREFRILNRVSGEKLITLRQELELCHAHLQVMSLRKAAQCSLAVHGVDEHRLVPPALFLTLVENGLTHLLPIAGHLRFELRADYREGRAHYTFRATGRREVSATPAAATREGTGLRYIKARLEESFTGQWALTSTPIPEGWQTKIVIGTSVQAATAAPAAGLDSEIGPRVLEEPT